MFKRSLSVSRSPEEAVAEELFSTICGAVCDGNSPAKNLLLSSSVFGLPPPEEEGFDVSAGLDVLEAEFVLPAKGSRSYCSICQEFLKMDFQGSSRAVYTLSRILQCRLHF